MADSTRRPIGWWLKEADAKLDRAFERQLGDEIDRRGWQVLASLAREPIPRDDLVSELAAFDPPKIIEEVLRDLGARGWIDASADQVKITLTGRATHAALAPSVDEIRQQIAAALPGDDYPALIRLLTTLVAALDVSGRRQ